MDLPIPIDANGATDDSATAPLLRPNQRLRLVRKEYPSRGAAENALGRAAKNEFSDPRVPIRTHYKQVDLVFADIRLKNIPNCSPIGLHVLGDDFHTMSRQMSRQFRNRLRFVDWLVVDDGEDPYVFRLLEKGQGILDRTRSGTARIPGHRDSFQGRGQFAFGVIWKDQNWPTRLKYQLLCGVSLDCDRLAERHHGEVAESCFMDKSPWNFK
jgi:hypothetical protein